jgi:uncharacterized membrane protein
MQGKATFGGHPIHPILTPYPIAFFTGALICDVISIFSGSVLWPKMSVVLIGFGIVGALLAAVFGFVDYLTAPMSVDAKKTATTHMLVNLTTIVIFIAAFFVRFIGGPPVLGYVLTVGGNIVLLVGGYLGGHLAYHYGVGVNADVAPPSRPSA